MLVVGAVAGRCPQGKYWSKVLSECVPCSKCTQSYLLRACSPERDSVCGDEIRLTLDWLHPSKQTHHFSKDRLSNIEQDLYSTSADSDFPDSEKKKPKHFHFPQEQSLEKSKHKKHKKHYEFDDTFSDREYKKKDRFEDKWHKKKVSFYLFILFFKGSVKVSVLLIWFYLKSFTDFMSFMFWLEWTLAIQKPALKKQIKLCFCTGLIDVMKSAKLNI